MSFEEYPGEYVDIPQDEYDAACNQNSIRKLGQRYGVSQLLIAQRKMSGDLSTRFLRKHIVPYVISTEELISYRGQPKVLAARARIRLSRLRIFCDCLRAHEKREDIRRRHMGASGNQPLREVTEGCCAIPPDVIPSTGPHIGNDTLAYLVAMGATPHHLSLQLLVEVELERVDTVMHPEQTAEYHRLVRLPLPLLQTAIQSLHEARDAWEAHFLRPAAHRLAQTRAQLLMERTHLLCFNTCLWQRRHPLPVVAMVLELYRSQLLGKCDQFAVEGTTWNVPRLLCNMMEALTEDLCPVLAAIPWLIRCDVLMVYPHMPLAEQVQWMQTAKQLGTAEGQGPASLRTPLQDEAGVPDSASAQPLTPELLLRGYLPIGMPVPDRYGQGLGSTEYRILRRAFESHKRDGVRRFSRLDY